MTKSVMLSAIQPTNVPTLGTYIGALKNWVKLQDQYDCIFFAVDLHSITVRQDPVKLRELTYHAIATYLACGIDPEKSTLFIQSHVPQHAELAWVLTCYAYMGELNRMTQFKDKSAKQGANIPAGLFTYPVLMAADILLYQTKLVPVGGDQKQHVELTRDLAERMNSLYGGDLFTMPEPYIPKIGGRVMSLQNPTAKMSKSDTDASATVYLDDSDDSIRKKFKRAVTDSGTEIAYDETQKPGVSNLIAIQSALTGQTPEQIVASYVGKQYGHLKVETAEIVVQAISPIRTQVEHRMKDRAELEKILRRGAERAQAQAEKTLKKVYDRIGFAPR
ncbi:MAG: tryptophan--tRNA ligase [Oligoflexia bacterium]|nr:tryptophan--tRNA ligase [Oligoflexia bacterium]